MNCKTNRGTNRGSAKSIGIIARGGLEEPKCRPRWHVRAGITDLVGFLHKTLVDVFKRISTWKGAKSTSIAEVGISTALDNTISS